MTLACAALAALFQLAGASPAAKTSAPDADAEWTWLKTRLPEAASYHTSAEADAWLAALLAWAPEGQTVAVYDRACQPLFLRRSEDTLCGAVHQSTVVRKNHKTAHAESICFGAAIEVTCGSDTDYDKSADGGWIEAGSGATGCSSWLPYVLSRVSADAVWYGGIRVTLHWKTPGEASALAAVSEPGSPAVTIVHGPGGGTLTQRLSDGGLHLERQETPEPPDSDRIEAALRGRRFVVEEKPPKYPVLFQSLEACQSYRRLHPPRPTDRVAW